MALAVHLVSFLLRLLALGFCVSLWRSTRDHRLGVLGVLLAAAALIEGRVVLAGGVAEALAFSGERVTIATLAVSLVLVALTWLLRSMVEGERDEREILAATLAGLREGVLWLDDDDTVVDLNGQMLELLGLEREHVKGMAVRTLLVLETPPDVTALPFDTAHVFDAVTPERSVQALLKTGEGMRHVELSLSTFAGGRVLMVHDRTEIREAEKEVLRTQKIESLGVLAGGIAHDFNNLLTAVSGHASLLAASEVPPHKVQELGRRIERAAQRGQQLSRQLLTFSRGGAPVPANASLSDLVDETARFVMHGQGRALQVEVEPGLRARVDTGQIGQVVQNLVLNACQATPPGGSIRVQLLRAGAEPAIGPGLFHQLVVEDDGPGVPTELRERIFEPFFTTREQGSGLGLSVCWSIVRQHGGRMVLENPAGGGARFRIWLPAEEAAAPLPRRIPEPLRGARVLLLDDEAAVREVASELLKHLGYDVTQVEDGAEAVAAWKARRFDLAVLDLTIPGGMGGLETLRQLRELEPGVRAVCSTGYAETSPDQWLREGFVGVLPKPYGLRDLKRVLADVLGDSTSTDDLSSLDER